MVYLSPVALSGFSQAVNHSGKPLRVAVLLVKSEQNGLSALLLCVFMCVRQAACGLLWLWRFMCLPWRAKLCSSTPQSASERESVCHPSRLFPATFPPLSHLCFIPSLTHTSAVFVITLSFILLLLLSISASLSATFFSRLLSWMLPGV